MIAYLSGIVQNVKSPSITLLVNGIGFAVHVPNRYMVHQGSHIALEIYSHMTQDNGIQLFGFETADEKAIFVLIIGCSGLGPKLGLAVLNALTPSSFVSAILTGDVRTLSSIEGVGLKKGESMILQLKDKIARLALTQPDMAIEGPAAQVKQLSDVLGSLGYSRPEISATLEHLRQTEVIAQASFDELVRKGLSFLAKKG